MSNGGGTLTLPSPTHPHHHHIVDVQAGLRSVRSSISRSPSKFPLRTSSQSSSDTGSSPSSPSIRRVQSQYFGQNSPSGNQPHTPHTQSPLATPFRPNAKLSLRSAKAAKSPASSNKPFSRHRTSPKSPSRRVLSQVSSTFCSNSSQSPSSSIDTLPSGQENLGFFHTRSPVSRKAAEKAANRHSMHLDMSGSSSQLSLSRFSEGNTTTTTLSSVASPLKRSDASMSLDQSISGSPNPKRRSYGPATMNLDFNVFDQVGATSPNQELQDDSGREYGWTTPTANITEPLISFTPPSVPVRRAGSLRKSTLQQRERTSWGKRNAAQQLAQSSGEVTTPQRERTSWGRRQAAQQSPNGTTTPIGKNRPRLSVEHFVPPASAAFGLPAPPPTPAPHQVQPQMFAQLNHQPHPLSRTITTSSSSSSGQASDSPMQFAMPIAEKSRAPMNFSKSLPVGAVRPQADKSSSALISTPDYKSDRPYEGAFASTGLVSKMNRNPELAPANSGFGAVPDTPCKKHASSFATYPPMQPLTSNAKARGRRMRHTFGVPSTPFDLATPNRTANVFTTDQPRPLLFNGFSTHSRKESLLSLYNDDGRSPSRKACGSDTSNDGDFPPTPTKQSTVPRGSSRLTRISTNESPTANRRLPPLSAVGSSMGMRRDAAASSSPLERMEFAEKTSPRTPQGNIVPPDASGLSISNANDNSPLAGDRNLNLPATPTTRQGNAPIFLERRAITPINGLPTHDVDEELIARFGKVEFLGKGEFSCVYKVIQPSQPRMSQQGYFSTPTHRSPGSPSSGKVYAVKKLTVPIQGMKDRAHRRREVCVLEDLRGCEHVLQLVDSWEESQCLYIQTEFCEEGSLDAYLNFVGLKGRLDDFRIWKILLEIGKGLRSIHEAGYIHLDLKPANIFINFEGTLKIGDFGLTTSLPLERGPDIEGDREYMAPEALRSEISQAADIFSFGLIMLEIAANVKLPENGATWTALREGDFSEVPTMTQAEDATPIARDANGMPLDDGDRSTNLFRESRNAKEPRRAYNFRSRQSADIFGLGRKNELQNPPDFMKDPNHPESLDIIIKSMLAPTPVDRPNIFHLLSLQAVNWVATRQRAAATVFEGNWGPADEVSSPPLSLDTEMTDV